MFLTEVAISAVFKYLDTLIFQMGRFVIPKKHGYNSRLFTFIRPLKQCKRIQGSMSQRYSPVLDMMSAQLFPPVV